MYSVIYSADYKFQVVNIVRAKHEIAWDIANEMEEKGIFAENKINHYDVISFTGLDEMNEWILIQVADSRY